MDKIKIGVLGCASIADKYMLPAILAENTLFNLSGVASRSIDKAKFFAQKFNSKAYLSYDDMLDDYDLDAIYIPLPNSMHFDWVFKALNRGLHVLVEKSLACSYTEVKLLCDLARNNNLALVENFQFRQHRQMDVIQDLISNGSIGEIRCMRSSFGFPPFIDKENIRYQKSLGGGALFDAGAYPVKLSQLLLGNRIDVKASSLIYDETMMVDVWGGAYLKCENHTFSEIAFGFDNFYQCNLEVWGSTGKINAERIFTSPPDKEVEILLDNKNGKQFITIPKDNHFRNMLKYFHHILIDSFFEKEYIQNLNQAYLLQKIREVANV